MGDKRSAWHLGFTAYVDEQKPEGTELQIESILSQEQRADIVLLKKVLPTGPTSGSLQRLWSLLPRYGIVEYKSRTGLPRPGVLHQLLGYGHILARKHRNELNAINDVALVLAVPSITPTLKKEVTWFDGKLQHIAPGYREVLRLHFPTYLVLLNELSDAERDPLLGFFGSKKVSSLNKQSRAWLVRHYQMNAQDLQDYEDFETMAAELAESAMGEAIKALVKKELIADAAQQMKNENLSPELQAQFLRILRANPEQDD